MHAALNEQSREYGLDPSSILLCEDMGTLAMSGLPRLTLTLYLWLTCLILACCRKDVTLPLLSPVSMCLQSRKMESKPSTGSNKKKDHMPNSECSMGCLIKKQEFMERQRSERITSLYLICMILCVGTCIITHICKVINGKRQSM